MSPDASTPCSARSHRSLSRAGSTRRTQTSRGSVWTGSAAALRPKRCERACMTSSGSRCRCASPGRGPRRRSAPTGRSRVLPFVGPKFAQALALAGIRTVGEAAAQDPRWLVAQFGQGGATLAERANGIDPAPVLAGGRERKQISREVTFSNDITDLDYLRAVLREHAERVGADLRSRGRRARTVSLKLRWQEFTTLSRSHTLERPAQSTSAILDAATALLDEIVRVEGFHPVRLIGLGVTNLVEDVVQLELLEAANGALAPPGRGDSQRQERIDAVLDALRERYGDASVRRGASDVSLRRGPWIRD
jgi:DNA polymerase IV